MQAPLPSLLATASLSPVRALGMVNERRNWGAMGVLANLCKLRQGCSVVWILWDSRQRTFVSPKTLLITPKVCSTLARTRDLAGIYSARLLNILAAPAMMPWTVADQSTEMARQVTLIGKPYGGRNIDQVHIGEDK